MALLPRVNAHASNAVSSLQPFRHRCLITSGGKRQRSRWLKAYGDTLQAAVNERAARYARHVVHARSCCPDKRAERARRRDARHAHAQHEVGWQR